MSNYNHSRKAGNNGDLFKHLVLVEVVRHLIDQKAATHSKDFTFGYTETHSGAPDHRLMPGGEWEQGIGKFLENDDMVDLNYFHYVVDGVQINSTYPSSWMLARKAIRSSAVETYDIRLFDTSAEVTKAVKPILTSDPRVHFECKDGFKHFKDKSLYRTDFVFIDPAYKTDKSERVSKDWVDVAKTAEYLIAKEIPFMIWYPFFTEKNPRALIKNLGLPTLELVDPTATDNNRVLKGSGLIFGNIDPQYVWELQQYIADTLKIIGTVTRFN